MLRVVNEQEMLAFGQRLAKFLVPGGIVHLKGPLGAGKTTLTRAIFQGLGHTGNVKSPTYTLVEPYEIDHKILRAPSARESLETESNSVRRG